MAATDISLDMNLKFEERLNHEHLRIGVKFGDW
jgi:hypothetical protein